MPPTIGLYLIMAGVVFGLNVIPAFMPATWSILAYFYIRHGLGLLPTVLIGASCATLGRIVLYILARDYLRPILSPKAQDNMTNLGKILNRSKKFTFAVVLAYAYLPIPSNQVFIAAGLARADIRIIAFSFLIGRLISYTFWISLTHRIVDNFETLLLRHYTRLGSTFLEIASILIIVLITQIPWKSVLRFLNSRQSAKLH